MKKTRLLLFVFAALLIPFSMACALLDLLQPTQPPLPTEESVLPPAEPTQPEAQPEPSATDEPLPTPEPTEVPPNHGQIAYAANGNIWRYLVDSGESFQVTFDGVADDYENEYGQPQFSADGRFLSYSKNGLTYLHNLETDSIVNLPVDIFHWSRLQPATFYAAADGFTCPAVENLEDQELISFDLLRYNADDLSAPVLVATIGGGLKFPQTISDDEQYASILHCACYSECGAYVIHHLPSSTPLSPPPDVYPGKIDFSPDSSRLVTNDQQMYGYYESPLYIANSDFSGATVLYSAPSTAVTGPQFSPDGGWVAFTLLEIADEYTLSDTRVMIVNLDGSVVLEIAAGGANLAAWSPEGNQILFSRGSSRMVAPFIYDLLSGTITALPFTAWGQMDWGVLP